MTALTRVSPLRDGRALFRALFAPLCYQHRLTDSESQHRFDCRWRNHAQNGFIGTMPEGLDWETLNGFKNQETGAGETREAVQRLCSELIRLVLGREASRLLVAPGEMNNHAHYAEVEILCAMLRLPSIESSLYLSDCRVR